MLDVTDVPCAVGDVVTLIGRDGDDLLTVRGRRPVRTSLALRTAHRAPLATAAPVRGPPMTNAPRSSCSTAWASAPRRTPTAYGDVGSDTLGNLSRAVAGGFDLPNLQSAGLGNIAPLAGVERTAHRRAPGGSWSRNPPGRTAPPDTGSSRDCTSPTRSPRIPQGFPAEVVERVRSPHGPRGHRQRRGQRDGHARSIRRGASAHGSVDSLHVGRFGLPGGGARSGDSAGRAVSRPARRRATCSSRRTTCRA